MKRPRIRDGDKGTLKSHHARMVPLCLWCPPALEWPVIPVPKGVFPAQQLQQHRHGCVFIYINIYVSIYVCVCVKERQTDYYIMYYMCVEAHSYGPCVYRWSRGRQTGLGSGLSSFQNNFS